MNEVAALKITSLQRCVARAREAHATGGDTFSTDFNLQDAAILNVGRACETAIDLANMLIRKKRLGISSESREAFRLLAREGLIASTLTDPLAAMVGFRNFAVRHYHKLDLEIVEAVIRKELDELLRFADATRQHLN